MGATHDPQLLKGVLSPLLLWLLAERESYGYELVQRLRAAGLSGISEGTVYPALSRLEREGRITSRLVASRSGPRPPHRPRRHEMTRTLTMIDRLRIEYAVWRLDGLLYDLRWRSRVAKR